MIRPMARQVLQAILRQIAIGINDGNPVALMDVLENQIPEKRRFPRTRFPTT